MFFISTQRIFSMDAIDNLVSEIKKKKSLSVLSSDVVKSEIVKYAHKHEMTLENLSNKDVKIIVQDVRAILRKMTGSFVAEDEKHKSTEERQDFYPILINKIKELNPSSILDLGCGLNPLKVAKQGVYYYAYDIDEKSINLVESFFNKNKIKGEAKVVDIRQESTFPRVDLCLIFKVLDVIDEKNHKNSESLINKINTKYFIISFPTKTLSNKPMRHPQRGWIEHLLSRLGYNFEFFSSKNEIFYLASKK
jgi:hypothetical protein